MRPLSLLSAVVLALGTIAMPGLAGESKMAKKDIPEKVLQSFQKAYPGVKIREQSTIKDGTAVLYKLGFTYEKTEHDVILNADGVITETNRNIPVSELPPAVVAACKTEFPKATIKDAETITRDSVVTYGLDLKIGRDRLGAVFSGSGKLIKKEESGEKESREDDKGERPDDK